MKLRTWMMAGVLVAACAACGEDDPQVQNNDANNENNSSNNANSGSNNANNGTTDPNNGNPLTCNGDFGADDACGGDPTGTWDVSEACSNFDYEAQLQQACSDVVVEDAVVNVGGTLTVDAVTWSRTVTGDITLTMSTASACGAGSCGLVETALGVVAAGATCTDDGSGGCDCTATVDLASNSMGTYTTDAGVVTLGSGETFHYCSSGGTMLIRRFGSPGDDGQPTVLYEQ